MNPFCIRRCSTWCSTSLGRYVRCVVSTAMVGPGVPKYDVSSLCQHGPTSTRGRTCHEDQGPSPISMLNPRCHNSSCLTKSAKESIPSGPGVPNEGWRAFASFVRRIRTTTTPLPPPRTMTRTTTTTVSWVITATWDTAFAFLATQKRPLMTDWEKNLTSLTTTHSTLCKLAQQGFYKKRNDAIARRPIQRWFWPRPLLVTPTCLRLRVEN